jgi:hypothetical protein
MIRRSQPLAVLLGGVLLIALGSGSVAASPTIRPAPGTPDPRAMVLAPADLGGARVTAQRYFKDSDFPSVISYVRELENGRSGETPLPYVESQAEIGTSPATTSAFLTALKRFFASPRARRDLAGSFVEGLGSNALVSDVRVGRPRALGVGAGSFDLSVSARLLGSPIELHVAVFRVERVLGMVTAVGDLGRRIPVSAMRRLASIMAGRTIVELVPQNIALPSVSGTAAVGEPLTANPGRWTGNPASYAYRWQRCGGSGSPCAQISGATGRTYRVADADVGATLRVAVSAKGMVISDAATSPPTGVVAVFIDAFTGAGPNSSWSLSVSGNGPTIAQANGQLEITLPAGTSPGPGGYATVSAFSRCRFPGDFDMQVEYRLLSGLLPFEGINVGFDAVEFAGETYSGQHGVFVHNAQGTHGISTNFPDPGVYRPPYNDFVPDSSRSGTLRLVRTTRAGVATMTASRLAAASWSFTSLPYPSPTSQAANLNVFTNVTPFTREVRVAFDNFRVNSGSITCP